jgi:hypothetical protein
MRQPPDSRKAGLAPGLEMETAIKLGSGSYGLFELNDQGAAKVCLAHGGYWLVTRRWNQLRLAVAQ